jgi:hypothetical protein
MLGTPSMLNARIIFLLSIASAAGLAAACGSSNNGDGNGSPDAGGGGQDASPATDATSASDTGNGGDSGGGGDAGRDTGVTDGGVSDGATGDGAFMTAPHPSLPLVIDQGGPVIAAPVVTSVTFNSPYTNSVSDLDAFVSGIGTQPFWAAATSQYGIAAPTVATAQHLTEAAPTTITDAQIKTWLTGKITSKAAGFADATANSLFVLYYPNTTVISQSATAKSCVQFGGYHGSTTATVGATTVYVPYAVVPECITPADAGATAFTTLQSTTSAASHEMVEAATDPYADRTMDPSAAYTGTLSLQTGTVDPYAAWPMGIVGSYGFLETGDMCESFGSSYFTPTGFPYQVQRTWSNANVKASKDPCAPYKDGELAYFLAQPVFDPNFAADEAKNPPVYTPQVNFTAQGQTIPTVGAKIAVGASATIPLILWSDAPTADWTVTVRDPAVAPGATSPYLSFALDKTTGHNGDTIMLTINVLSANATLGGEVFVVTSTDNVLKHSAYGFVGQN